MKMLNNQLVDEREKMKNLYNQNRSVNVVSRAILKKEIVSHMLTHTNSWTNIELFDHEQWEDTCKRTRFFEDVFDKQESIAQDIYGIKLSEPFISDEQIDEFAIFPQYYHIISVLMAIEIGDAQKIEQYLKCSPKKLEVIIKITNDPIAILIYPALMPLIRTGSRLVRGEAK